MRKDFINLIKSFKVFIKQLRNILYKLIIYVINFLRPYEQSVYKSVCPEEFYRIIILALSAGGGFDGFVGYLKNHVKDFITDPNMSVGIQEFVKHCAEKHLALAIFILFFTMDYIRRKFHGAVKN